MQGRTFAKNWLLIAGLCFLAPLGLYLALRHYKLRKAAVVALAVAFVPLFFAECAFGAMYFVASDIQKNSPPAISASVQPDSQPTPAPEPVASESPAQTPAASSTAAESQSAAPESSQDEPESAQEEPESTPESLPESSEETPSIIPVTGR